MTAEQLSSYARSKILSKVNFDTKSSVRVTYLGQLRKEHFFMLTIVPATVSTNATAIKESVEILNKIGFTDAHWIHNLWDDEKKYYYYCYIDNTIMVNIKE